MSLDFAAFKPQNKDQRNPSTRPQRGRRFSPTLLYRKYPIYFQLTFCITLSISTLLLSGLVLPFLLHLTAGIPEIAILLIWGLYWLFFFRLVRGAEKKRISCLGLLGVGSVAVFLQPLPFGHLLLILEMYPTIQRKFKLNPNPSDLLEYDRRIPRVSPECDNRLGNFHCR
jgi:hypothetical protein